MARPSSSTKAPKSTSRASKPARSTPKKNSKFSSRAVLRDVEAGSVVDCAHCGERVKFQAKVRNRQVIANVYVRGTWDRVEHFHAECYDLADKPYGEIVGPLDQRKTTISTMTRATG